MLWHYATAAQWRGDLVEALDCVARAPAVGYRDELAEQDRAARALGPERVDDAQYLRARMDYGVVLMLLIEGGVKG